MLGDVKAKSSQSSISWIFLLVGGILLVLFGGILISYSTSPSFVQETHKPVSRVTAEFEFEELPSYPIEWFDPADTWVLLVRIQKTASKTFLSQLRSIISKNFGWNAGGQKFCCSFGMYDQRYLFNDYRCDVYHRKYIEASAYRTNKHHLKTYHKGIFFAHADYTDTIGILEEIKEKYIGMYLLRSPYERVVSEWKHYHFDCRGRWEYPAHSCKEMDHSKEAFLDFLRDDGNLGMFNRQTRMIAGYDNCPPDGDLDLCLKIAKEHLKAAHYIAIGERIEDSMDLLYLMFGVLDQEPSSLLKAQVDKGDGQHYFDIDEEVKKEIYLKNSLDHELYLYAVDLFDSILAKHQDQINQ